MGSRIGDAVGPRRVTRSIRLGLAVVAVLTTVACAGDNASPESTTTIRDSAGITIVENSGPTWTESDAWTLGPAPKPQV